MANDIYSNYNIDSNKLKRDYLKNPLHIAKNGVGSEMPYKEDLIYLYIELNISKIDLITYFNVSKEPIRRWMRYYNIKKDRHLSVIHRVKTNLEKYGVSNISQTKEIKEKKKQTNLEKYGVEYISQSKEVQEKIKQTCLKKYGVEHSSQSKEVKEKQKQTNLEKYGVEYSLQSKEVQEKIYNTMKKNHTFNTSKPEDEIYELLCFKYKEVKRQHKEDRYPFNCDFYIPELDLFVEYQGFWTHGGEPYTGTKEQQKKIKLWESKNTRQYNKAINDWTIKDPLKRKIAKENKLNYLEFFNLDEFMGWYNKQ